MHDDLDGRVAANYSYGKRTVAVDWMLRRAAADQFDFVGAAPLGKHQPSAAGIDTITREAHVEPALHDERRYLRWHCLAVGAGVSSLCAVLIAGAVFGQVPVDSAAPVSPSPTTVPLPKGGLPASTRRSAPADPTASGRFSSKVQRYAVRLMSKYDLNGDHLLDQSEWIAMHGEPAGTMDLDGDGVITTDEIVTRVASYGRRSLRVVPGVPVRSVEANGETEDTETGKRMAYRVVPEGEHPQASTQADSSSPGLRMMRRFFVIPSQLPQGVAGWFLDNDADGDGQVTMAEFSANWTEVEAARFNSYDLNGDGVITAAECAKAEAERAADEAAADKADAEKANAGKTDAAKVDTAAKLMS